MPGPQAPRAQPRELPGVRLRFALGAGVVVLLACLVREYFVLATIVDIPIRGDIREYVIYALNLYRHGVFSVATPDTGIPTPDAYRSPGYPWLLALCMFLRPRGDGWYALALQMQVLLGTATVWLTMLLARRWLRPGWAIAAGLLLAIWPHHVAATGALLSEVAFGFTLMAALYCLARAMEGGRMVFLVLAALAFAYAWLINPLIALFPPVIALLVWRENGRGAALLFIGIFLLPMLAFALRNAQLDGQGSSAEHRTGRAAMNFVQGSWPEYHWAWQMQRFQDPASMAVIQQISQETETLTDRPKLGIAQIAERLSSHPAYYAAWYFWQKPWLLWSWEIQLGPGDVYVLEVRNSPLQTHPLLRWCSTMLRVLNPLLSLLGLCGMMAVLVNGLRRGRSGSAAALATGAIALYLTAIHTVFQAEPRYANAYRGIEILLLMTAMKLLVDALRHWKHQRDPARVRRRT
jgi:4-amino-4-deoxy-L-arabinose transferase-like glycosyltransferase